MTTHGDLPMLFDHYGSDKTRNRYAGVYHALFKHHRETIEDVLEIGIGTLIPGLPSSMVGYSLPGYRPGGSLRAWRDYFPHARVYGLDVAPDTMIVGEERIQTCLADSQRHESVKKLEAEGWPQTFDFIVDDGLHAPDAQLATLRNFFPLVKAGGYYIVEDVFPGSSFLDRLSEVADIVGETPFFMAKDNALIVFSL